ncbi:hypothetical protein C2857_002376 [Epichloe festucae Fl1]|uniref:Uncharacterized protein n=1 Tax=Epichloe festucae (strain Fl1) TaxID=877507 RepID=A0A7S9KUQ2_EPIFF|nr:hypothetical protein C2857_002376 [Epichloe festucae Fl1]
MRFVLFVLAVASAAFAAPVDGDAHWDPSAIKKPGPIPDCCHLTNLIGDSCVSASTMLPPLKGLKGYATKSSS